MCKSLFSPVGQRFYAMDKHGYKALINRQVVHIVHTLLFLIFFVHSFYGVLHKVIHLPLRGALSP